MQEDCGCPPDKGHTHPRIYTPPLGELTPETTFGFQFVEFCDVIGFKLLPWQRWLALHALEKNASGGFRFRTLLVLLPRQNGKTTFFGMIILWMLVVRQTPLILGAAQDLKTAEETWTSVVEMLETHPLLKGLMSREPIRTNGMKAVHLAGGIRYLPIAARGGAGRGMSPQVVLLDEVREHKNFLAYSALAKATQAQRDALIICTSNAGDGTSVVLNELQDTAHADIAEGRADTRLGLFEWSAFDRDDALADPYSFESARISNPSLGYTIEWDTIKASHRTDPLNVLKVEVLCVGVHTMNSVFSITKFIEAGDPRNTLAQFVGVKPIHLHIDVAPSLDNAVLYGACQIDGKVLFERIMEWKGPSTNRDIGDQLPSLIKVLKPVRISRYPKTTGGQSLDTIWRDIRGVRKVDYPSTAASGHIALFTTLLGRGDLRHPGDDLVVEQARRAVKVVHGDVWSVKRESAEGSVTALYGVFGAVAGAWKKTSSTSIVLEA